MAAPPQREDRPSKTHNAQESAPITHAGRIDAAVAAFVVVVVTRKTSPAAAQGDHNFAGRTTTMVVSHATI